MEMVLIADPLDGGRVPANQGCGVGGKIFDSNSDFPKFPTPTP